MLNENNKSILIKDEKNPLKVYEISNCGSFSCTGAVGEGKLLGDSINYLKF